VPGAVGGFLILDAIRASGGCAVAVGEDEIAAMQGLVAARTGLFSGLETAAAVAALPRLLDAGAIPAGDRIVVFDTCSGFKSPSPTAESTAAAIPNEEAALAGGGGVAPLGRAGNRLHRSFAPTRPPAGGESA
jgi:threonine synthase